MIGLGVSTSCGKIRVILGLYWENGKENGNDYLGFRGSLNLGFAVSRFEYLHALGLKQFAFWGFAAGAP